MNNDNDYGNDYGNATSTGWHPTMLAYVPPDDGATDVIVENPQGAAPAPAPELSATPPVTAAPQPTTSSNQPFSPQTPITPQPPQPAIQPAAPVAPAPAPQPVIEPIQPVAPPVSTPPTPTPPPVQPVDTTPQPAPAQPVIPPPEPAPVTPAPVEPAAPVQQEPAPVQLVAPTPVVPPPAAPASVSQPEPTPAVQPVTQPAPVAQPAPVPEPSAAPVAPAPVIPPTPVATPAPTPEPVAPQPTPQTVETTAPAPIPAPAPAPEPPKTPEPPQPPPPPPSAFSTAPDVKPSATDAKKLNISVPAPDKKVVTTVAAVLLAVGLVAGGFYGFNALQNNKQTAGSSKKSIAAASPSKVPQQVLGIVDSVKEKVNDLPEDETPTIATVTNLAKLQGQEFFAKAQMGDKVLIYSNARKAYLYRPSTKEIIMQSEVEVAGDRDQTSTASAETTSSKTGKPVLKIKF